MKVAAIDCRHYELEFTVLKVHVSGWLNRRLREIQGGAGQTVGSPW